MEELIDFDSILIDSIIIDSLLYSELEECPICYEKKYNRFYGNCMHWWCLDCHSKMYKYYTCPICREPFRTPPPKNNDIWIGPPTSPINLEQYNSIVRRRVLRQVRNRNSNRYNNVRIRRRLLCNGSCIIS